MAETDNLPEEEEVEAQGFTKPGGGDSLSPPDPSRSDDEDDVEGHGFVKPPSGDSLNPPDPS
jgi:hypothetical protein